MGWTPKTLMFEAEIIDLADAMSGYAMKTAIHKQPPSEEFMRDMIKKFPDKEKNKK